MKPKELIEKAPDVIDLIAAQNDPSTEAILAPPESTEED
jgi:hypothetical protein